MKNLGIVRRAGALVLSAGLVTLAAACGSSGTTGSSGGSSGSSNSITVAVAYPAPPSALLDQFTKQTGIKVNWVNIGWDDQQTKIAAAMTANTYFADVADVDWSKVGEYQKTGWFDPLNKYYDVASLRADMPQLNTFVSNNELMGVPFDSSFLVTTVNTKDFAKAGITTMPTTLAGLTAALQKVGKANGMASPLDMQFATAEGLSTCWYQMTAAFGGQVLTAQDTPAFTSPSSPGYQAMAWMVNAYKSGLVPKANVNTTDYQGFTTEEAKNRTAAALCDYSGSVASIYNVPASSSVVNETQYIPTPGATAVGLNVANPDGIGIPKTAKNVAGAVKFINWFTDTENQAIWAGLKGSKDVVSTFPLPARLSSFNLMVKAGNIAQAAQLAAILKAHAQAPFPNGAPPWYVQFSAAVQTNVHEAAAGQETVQQAVSAIGAEANQLKSAG
ncbi:MAG: multiple sugar transport system substrate-binding protein [Trebonia sp.]|nr:multiple sugar transport system substrate-binding protein [Trebonia sp.]